MKKRFLNGDILFGLLTLVVSIIFFAASFQYHGMKGDSGPGTFPRIIAVVTALLSLILIITGALSKGKEAAAEDTGSRRVFWCSLILMAFYLISWQYVHFIICTLVFLLLMSWVLKLSWKFAIIYSVVFAVGIYYIFANIFHILL